MHDRDRAATYLQRIDEATDPSDELLNILAEIEYDSSLSVYIYECAAPRIVIRHYWILYRVARSYLLLGRDEASFLVACSAITMEPKFINWHMYEIVYLYLVARQRYNEAIAVVERQLAQNPDAPIVNRAQYDDLLRRVGRPIAPPYNGRISPETGTIRRVHEASTLVLDLSGRYGSEGKGSSCWALERFNGQIQRPEVDVLELVDAEAIVFNGSVLLRDRHGDLVEHFSTHDFPQALLSHVLHLPDFASFPIHDADLACVIVDRYTTANVCHFLYDHITRLSLYGTSEDVRSGIVIGPSASTDYQRRTIERLGLRRYIDAGTHFDTSGRHVVRARRLLVSRTCKSTFVHPAHLGADWALGYLRTAFEVNDTPPVPPRKIYVSRRDASHRRIRNEEQVMALLSKAGFEEVVLGELAFDAQIALFRAATHVVGMHGAGLTGMVFTPPGASILEVAHPLAGTAAYAVVGATADVRYSVLVGVDAESDEPRFNDWRKTDDEAGMAGRLAFDNRDVRVDLSELERWLEDSGAQP